MRGSARSAATPVAPDCERTRTLFGRGFRAMAPLWAGAVPVGIVYGVTARAAPLSIAETQLMSIVVFSAAAQISAVSLLAAGAPTAALIGAALALNAQLLLLGLSVGRQARPTGPARLLTAFFLTDGAYGVTAASGPLRLPVLIGAGVSMFLAWNAGTAIGAVAGQALPDPRRLGVDFVVPLTFLAVLVPLLRTRTAALVALTAGATALLLARVLPSGITVLGAGLAGITAGARRTRHTRQPASSDAGDPHGQPR